MQLYCLVEVTPAIEAVEAVAAVEATETTPAIEAVEAVEAVEAQYEIIHGPKVLPKRYKGINNFHNLPEEDIASYGFYKVTKEVLGENQRLGDAIIDGELKTVTYSAVDISQEEIDTKVEAIKQQKYSELWQAAYDYEFAQISGTAVAMLTALVLNGNPKGVAVQMWCKSIWDIYYPRKFAVAADHTVTIDTDYSICGEIPHTIPELVVEYEALMTA